MSSSTPTISIITATWNCQSTVSNCLASVASQTWPKIQHVVVDGASTDGTLEVLEANRGQLAVLQSEPDNGIYDALNKALALVTGDVVGFLHADDLYAHSHVLERVAKVFADPSICAVYGDLQYVSQNDPAKTVRHWKSRAFTSGQLNLGWMPPHPTLYVRREWYERIGGFNTDFRIAADYLSILQLFSHPEFKAVYLPEVLIKMRLGGASNKSLKNIAGKTHEDWKALRMTRVGALGGVGALVWKNLSKIGQFF